MLDKWYYWLVKISLRLGFNKYWLCNITSWVLGKLVYVSEPLVPHLENGIMSVLSNAGYLLRIKISNAQETRQSQYKQVKIQMPVLVVVVNLLSQQGICAFTFSFLSAEWKVLRIYRCYNCILSRYFYIISNYTCLQY